ncbi:class I SAM-dependent methyltransferase [Microbacterium sp. BK668]|uniref:class I SAM-dependent methyltransferase n=1 Tax=Microbacterium sp. BK668 TaxID=2512118 RepID=UPI00105D46FD|nr:class I SAM-dependent methyltransferase [Microbacterium sp. BK668]TDN91890.1 ubiquinone/menaquinone biosynthesis C-methylase UbiE [Microbacterium sp. BK668]
MSFEVPAAVYDAYMGRFSIPLAEEFVRWVDPPEGGRVLDVGCGTGALTAVLARRYGVAEVAGVDPSHSFVRSTAERFRYADIRHGTAEDLPFDDDVFVAALAELVVHFMTDAAAGAREMVRVTRRGGVVALCVWDLENERAPFSLFARAARAETGSSMGLAGRAGTRAGDLAALLEKAGCAGVSETALSVTVEYADFEEWWRLQTHGTGTIADALEGLDDDGIGRVRARAFEALGAGPFTVSATAWAARGTV